MKTQVGIWIDHREANMVFLSPDGEETKQIQSNVEKQLRRSGVSPSNERFETQMVPASDRREQGYAGHLASYSVFIFGPGEAKGELRKHFQKHRLFTRIVGFETADKMTTRQITQKVRSFYTVPPVIHLTNDDPARVEAKAAI